MRDTLPSVCGVCVCVCTFCKNVWKITALLHEADSVCVCSGHQGDSRDMREHVQQLAWNVCVPPVGLLTHAI